MAYSIQTRKTGALASTMAAGATSCTLAASTFGSPSGTQIITIDGGVAAKAADFACTIAGTSITSMVLLNGPDVEHAADAAVWMGMVDEHYDRVAVRTLGYAEVTANQGSITTVTDLTSLSVTVTVPTGGARIKITGLIRVQTTVNADTVQLSIKEGATTLHVATVALPSSGFATTLMAVYTPTTTATAGSHTYKLTLERAGGTGTLTMVASATAPAFILVENIE